MMKVRRLNICNWYFDKSVKPEPERKSALVLELKIYKGRISAQGIQKVAWEAFVAVVDNFLVKYKAPN